MCQASNNAPVRINVAEHAYTPNLTCVLSPRADEMLLRAIEGITFLVGEMCYTMVIYGR